MAVVFKKTKYLTDKTMHYCPGCTHGISHRLVAEVLEDLEKAGKMPEGAIGICPVGCSVFAYDYFNIDMQEASHGRAPAVATGTKLVRPNSIVFTYQGDGDLASTLLGQKSTTSPYGRDPIKNGYPVRMCELLATLDGPSYIARCTLADIKGIRDAKKCIQKAFNYQVEGKGFSFVELLSTCPTNWHMSPLQALEYVKEKMTPVYPLGVFKEV